MHSRVLCLALVLLPYLIPSSAREVNFTDIFVEPDAATIAEPIPKIAHFVFSKVRELVWLEYASIKSAAVNVGVDQVSRDIARGVVTFRRHIGSYSVFLFFFIDQFMGAAESSFHRRNLAPRSRDARISCT